MTTTQRTLLLGIDGGGTATTALLADAEGQIRGRGAAGPANYHVVGLAAAVAAVDDATSAALAEARAPSDAVAAACLGLAGADRAEDRRKLSAAVGPLGLAARLRVTTDAEIALAAGNPTAIGVVVIAGTGSIAFGRNAAGRTARAGGWGYLLGDEGSGFWIGREALNAAARAADGRAMATALLDAVRAAWGIGEPLELIPAVYGSEGFRPKIAALTPLVAGAAAAGDAVARSILDRAGEELALAAHAVIRGLELGPAPAVVVSGGVLLGCVPVQARFRSALHQACPSARIAPLEAEPALGAVRLARRLLQETPP